MEINYTFLIQLGIFLYVLFTLHFLFFKPVLGVLKKREDLTVGRVEEAADFQKKMESLQTRYTTEVNSVRQSLDEQRQEAIRRSREITEKKIQEAKERVNRQTAEKRALLDQEYQKVKVKLPGLSDSVAAEVVDAMLNGKVVRL